MKNDVMSKLSAGLLVLVMALSALIFLPAGNEGQTTSTANIYVPVVENGSPVPGAYVNLTEVHTGAVIPAQYSTENGYYYVTAPPSGYYRISVIDADYLDVPSASYESFDGRTTVTAPLVDLTKLEDKVFSIEVTVTDTTPSPLVGARISVYDGTAREFVSTAATTTNSSGKAFISMFNTNTLPGHTFYLVVSKLNYEMSATVATFTSSNPMTVQLSASCKISGWVNDVNGPAQGVVSYLINKDPSVPWVKRILRDTGASVGFDAYPGDFVLVIDGTGDDGYTQNLTVAGSADITIPTLSLQTKREAQTGITYGIDFTSFGLGVSGAWQYDMAHPGLAFSDLGNLRMQVDLTLGNGDGYLSAAEATDFRDLTYGWGTEYVASDGLLVLNETRYYANLASFSGLPFDLTPGYVDVELGAVPFSYTCSYTASVDIGAGNYTAIVYARYDTDTVNNTYFVNLPPNYELVGNVTTYTKVMGYLNVTLDPPAGLTTSEPVELGIQVQEDPSATAEMTQSPGVVYAEKDANNTVLRYFVRVQTNVTFSADKSYDLNGENPILFTWDFADGSLPVTTASETYVYNYSTAAAERLVTLNVTDVSGRYDVATIRVVCDNLDPTPVITAKDQPYNATDNSISVSQRDSVKFNAEDSSDDVATVGDGDGLIDYFFVDYGDGNQSARVYWSQADRNVSHSFANAGKFFVNLSLTDVAGHSKNATLIVYVNDTTAPSVSFAVKNETGSATLTEKIPLWFDASSTTDNLDKNVSLTFSWNFGDGTWYNGTGTDYVNVTHTYTTPKSYTVTLKVTDLAGNNQSTPKIITVGSGPRPKMTVDNVYYVTDPAAYQSVNFTEGKRGYIVVNMTNSGTFYATGIQVNVYLIKADGTEQLLGTWTEVLNSTTGASTTNVSIGGKVQVKFPWTFDTKGSYQIKLNVTATNQLNPTIYTAPSKISVKSAPWKQYILWIGVVVVLVLVPLLIYLRSRWSKRERKGPRREKKEKPGQSEEEL